MYYSPISSIETDILLSLDFENIISDFVSEKLRHIARDNDLFNTMS